MKKTFVFRKLSPELEEVLMEELHTLKGGNGGGSENWLNEVEIIGEAPEEPEEEEEEEDDDDDEYPDPDPDFDPWDDENWGGGDPGENPADIINNVENPCLKAVVSSLLNGDITGKMGEILSNLSGNVNVNINVFEAANNANGLPGMTSNTSWSTLGNTTTFSTNITFSTSHLTGGSQEYAAAVFMHEILHAHFRQTTGTKEAFEGMDHNTIAANYVDPMAEFLADMFNMDIIDATALAWNGLADSDCFKDATEFEIKDGDHTHTLSKEALTTLSNKYVLNIDDKGTSLCP